MEDFLREHNIAANLSLISGVGAFWRK
ncbi:MAG: hypothetical protein AB1452_06290 [Pseudomonadota bacterium]